MKKLLLIFILLIPIASAFTSDNSWRISTTTLSFDEENLSGSANTINQKLENSIIGRFWQRLSDSIPPTAFNLSSPTNPTSSTDTTPILTWDSSTDEHLDRYIIEISNESDFSVINYTYTVDNLITSFSDHSIPLTPGQWFWRVIAYDINDNSATTDYFNYTIEGEIREGEVTTIISTTTTTTSGGTKPQPFSLDIIAPPTITIYANDIITVPLIVTNPSKDVILNYINLSTFSDSTDVSPSLSLNSILLLRPKKKKKVDLRIVTHTDPGTYGITITAEVIKPFFKDSVRIYANLIDKDKEDRTTASQQLDFAKEFFDGNPTCSDLIQYLTEAETALSQNKFDQALNLANNAIQACKDLIALKELPSKKSYSPESLIKNLLKNKSTPIIALEIIGVLLILIILSKFLIKRKRIHPKL